MRAVPLCVDAGQRQGSRLPAPPPLARERERTLWTEQTQALTALGVAARICWQAKLQAASMFELTQGAGWHSLTVPFAHER
jgi:hypothetical protein